MTRLHGTRGFTVMELAMALSIAAILVRISVPMLDQFLRDARAAKAAADFNVIRSAAFASFESNAHWPAECGPGVMPPELAPYLPRGFTFDRGQYQLDWENWSISDSDEGQSLQGEVVAVSVVTEDPDLGRAILRVLGSGTVGWLAGDHYTFLIQSTLQPVTAGKAAAAK